MTTIAAIQTQYASAARRITSASSSGEPAEPVRAVPRVTREEPRRHELLDAMNLVLNAAADGAPADDEASQSVLRFAHALMHDLRTLGGEEGAAPVDGARAQAWGDLPQRLSALATAASKPAADTLVAVAEIPDEPSPVTTATVAVHIMKVPSSRLLEAFISMHRALGQQVELLAGREREALAQLASKLAGSVKGNPGAARSAGHVLDVKA
jgi:hypothetical protein